MSTHPEKSIKEIILLAFGAAMIGSSIIFGFVMLGKEYSRLITNPTFYSSSWQCIILQSCMSSDY